MNRQQAIELARAFAVRNGDDPYHEYQPTPEKARNWLPHDWVVDAIVSAAEERNRTVETRILTALADWVAESWHAEVKNRPLVNVHRRTLDDTWRQVFRHLGFDDRARLGPTHDELRSELTTDQFMAAAQGSGQEALDARRLVDEEILKIANKQYKPMVSAHHYIPQDYPNWLIDFAKAVESEVLGRIK